MGNDFLSIISTNLLPTLLFLLPVCLANMAPVVLWRTNWWKAARVPIDFGVEWNGIRVFGNNKTYFGMLSAFVGGGLGGALVYLILGGGLEGGLIWGVIVGGVLGLGAILGDLVESFFKRRLKIRPGAPLIYWDQVDFVIGAWVMYQLINMILPLEGNMGWMQVSVWTLLIAMIIAPGFHLAANILAYKLGWKKVWW